MARAIFTLLTTFSKIYTSTAAPVEALGALGVSYPNSFGVNTAYFLNTSTWFLGMTSGGVFKTTNTEFSWAQSSSGIKALSAINKLFVTPTKIICLWGGVVVRVTLFY